MTSNDGHRANGSGPTFVIGGKSGQLGNRLFFTSHIIALAQRLSGRVVNPALAEYANSFEGTRRDWLCRWPSADLASEAVSTRRRRALFSTANLAARVIGRIPALAPRLQTIGLHEGQSAEHRVDSEAFLRRLRAARVAFISGWVELEHVRLAQVDGLRSYFKPVERHAQRIAALITSARSACEVLVGVHIRQGDYAGFLGGRYFFETRNYHEMMRAMAVLFPGKRVGFVVCSNCPQSAPTTLPEPIFAGTGDAVEDLYALAECDYICGPPSTFSLWASFYGRRPLWQMRTAEARPRLEEFYVATFD